MRTAATRSCADWPRKRLCGRSIWSAARCCAATLVRIAEHDHVLLLTMHHIVCDGWSMGVLRQEIAQNYASLLQERPARLAPLPIQYADFAAWQREQLTGETLERLQDYWSKQLANLPGPLELPLDFRRPAVQTFRGDVPPPPTRHAA